MWVIRVVPKEAQKIKEYLLKHNFFDKKYSISRDASFIYFPLTKNTLPRTFKNAVILQKRSKLFKHTPSLQELLKNDLSKKELSLLPSAFDVIGDILILELPQELLKKERIIGKAYLQVHKSVNTVARRAGIHSGVYRTRKIKILAGKKTTITTHRENGVRIKVDVENMYFSNRLATERLRIAKQIKKNEDVLVMFSGSGVYPVVFAKNAEPKTIYGVEINPKAHTYAQENIKANKTDSNINLYKGDVREVLPTIKKRFDRIAMPLPKTGEEFLPLAFSKLKKNGILHLYTFLEEGKITSEAAKIRKICKEHNKTCRILRKIKCGQHAPWVYRVCFDIKVY